MYFSIDRNYMIVCMIDTLLISELRKIALITTHNAVGAHLFKLIRKKCVHF